jgi:hypothetical protein
MKLTAKLLMMIICIPGLIMFGCKKDSEVTYTYTIVPLTMLGFSNAPTAVLNQSFVRQLPAMGGKPPYTWTLVEGTLPPGLSVETTKGRILGTPTTEGQYTYTLKLTDSKGTTVTNQYTQTISTSGTTPFMLGTPQIPEYGQDQDVGYNFFAQGGALPWTFTITGLPAGVTYDPVSGLISGTPSAPYSGSVTITLVDANGTPAAGSPLTVSFTVNAPVPTGGGGGGNPTGCKAYEGTYMGTFEYIYHVKGQNDTWNEVPASFQLTLKFECLASAAGSTVLNITHANCSDANFACQVGGCTPNYGSVAMLPEDPPTNSSNPSQPGQGITLFFPNGATLGTANSTGNLNVSSDGRTLQNSLDPSIKDNTWVAIAGDFGNSVPPGGPVTKFTKWILTWSNTLKDSHRTLLSTVPGNPCTDSSN